MKVSKHARKNATLLMLHQRKFMSTTGEVDTPKMTAYMVARWHGIAQSSAWHILNELCASHFVNRHKSPGESLTITYSLNERGQAYVDKHILTCVEARDLVFDAKLEKYKRSLQE